MPRTSSVKNWYVLNELICCRNWQLLYIINHELISLTKFGSLNLCKIVCGKKMVGVGGSGSRAGDGSRRRLPSWMAGVNVNKSDGEGLDRNSNSKEPADIVEKSETARRPRRRKSTQRHQQEEEEEEGGEINVTRTQKKRKVREPTPPKKRKKLKQIIQTSVDQIEDDNNANGDEKGEEEEEEQLTLTVEDLLSIAKEVTCAFSCSKFLY